MVLCFEYIRSISVDSHSVAQFWLCHWSTKIGRGYGDVCIFAKYSEEAVKMERICQPAEGCFVGCGGEEESLAFSRETKS